MVKDNYYEGRKSVIDETIDYLDKQIELNNIAKIAKELEKIRDIPAICTITGDTNGLIKTKLYLQKKATNGIKAKLGYN